MKRIYRALIATLIVLCLGITTASPALALPTLPPIETDYWVPDGPVYALARDPVSGSLYLGGDFDSVNPYTGHMLALSIDTAQPNLNLPIFNGDVSVIIPDPNGGWYVGGNFTRVDEGNKTGVARFDANFELDPDFWISIKNMVNGNEEEAQVHALAATTDYLYIGGLFTSVGSSSKKNLAMISLSTRFPTSWSPDPNGIVRALHIDGDSLFVGGDFTIVSGTAQVGLACFTSPPLPEPPLPVILPTLKSWNANLSGSVYTLDSLDGYLFAGGQFTFTDGQNLGVFDMLNAAPYPGFSSVPNGLVRVVRITGKDAVLNARIYIGGDFKSIDSLIKYPYLARYQPVDNGNGYDLQLDPTYQPLPDAPVRAITENNNPPDNNYPLYIGGEFQTIGALEASWLARLDNAGAVDPGWLPPLQARAGDVYAVAIAGDRVLIGGNFFSAGGEKRSSLAALNATGALISTFDAPINGEVRALLLDEDVLYVGGSFDGIGSSTPQNLAALDASTGAVNPDWLPDPNNMVRALSADNHSIIAGGDFTDLQGEPDQDYLAWIDPESGDATLHHLGLPGAVYALALHQDDQLLVGGSSGSSGYAARVSMSTTPDLMTAQSLPAPAFAAPVTSILASNRMVLLGSDHLDARNPQTYLPLNGYPSLSGEVHALAAQGSYQYAAGTFTVSGVDLSSLTSFWSNGTVVDSDWLPPASDATSSAGQVRALATSDGIVYAGGTFTQFYSVNRPTDAYERPYLIVLEHTSYSVYLPTVKK